MNYSDPLVSVPASLASSLAGALSALDAQEGAQILRDLGLALGEPLTDLLEQRVGESSGSDMADVEQDEFWNGLARLFSELGWGQLTHETPRPGVGGLVAREWWESAGERSAAHPACHLTTGALAELLRRVAGHTVAVLEVECRTRGDDACRWVFGGEETLEQVFREMQDGASYGRALDALA